MKDESNSGFSYNASCTGSFLRSERHHHQNGEQTQRIRNRNPGIIDYQARQKRRGNQTNKHCRGTYDTMNQSASFMGNSEKIVHGQDYLYMDQLHKKARRTADMNFTMESGDSQSSWHSISLQAAQNTELQERQRKMEDEMCKAPQLKALRNTCCFGGINGAPKQVNSICSIF